MRSNTDLLPRTVLVFLLGALAAGVASGAPGDTTVAQRGGGTGPHALSGDGRYLAFSSANSTFVPGDTNGTEDVFIKDLQSGLVQRVSVNSQAVQGNRQSDSPAISHDGRFVAFRSLASNLVPNDRNGRRDIFVRDRQLGITERVSVTSAGREEKGNALNPAISANGRFIAFHFLGPTSIDIRLRDRKTATTELINLDENGQRLSLSGATSPDVSISADGRYVVFQVIPDDVANRDGVFLRDRLTGAVERQTRDIGGNVLRGYQPVISANGRYVAFYSQEDALSDYHLLVRDRQTGMFQTASIDPSGTPVATSLTLYTLSGSGRFVAFTSDVLDVFERDMQTGITERVSVSSNGVDGNERSFDGYMSSDGKRIVFESFATNLVPATPLPPPNMFLRETTVPAAALSVGPLALGFFGQTANTSSPAQTVRITNSSSAPAAITSIAFVGTHPGQFSRNDNCPATLPARGSCTVSVTFRPTSQGVKTAQLNVNGGGGGLRSVVLSGKGTAP